MTHRRLIVALLLLGLLPLIALGLLWLAQPRVRIDRATYEQLKPGMTLPEVESLFGVPPGIYVNGEAMIKVRCHFVPVRCVDCFVEFEDHLVWASDELCVVVGFGQQGKVVASRAWPVIRETESWSLRRVIQTLRRTCR